MVDLLRIIIIIGLVWWAFFREDRTTNILTVLALGIASLISLDTMMNYHGSKVRGLGFILYGTFVIFFVEMLIYIYNIFRKAIKEVYGYILRKMISFIVLLIVTVFIYYVVGEICIEEFGIDIYTSQEYIIKSSIIVLSIVFYITQYFLGSAVGVSDEKDVVDGTMHTEVRDQQNKDKVILEKEKELPRLKDVKKNDYNKLKFVEISKQPSTIYDNNKDENGFVLTPFDETPIEEGYGYDKELITPIREERVSLCKVESNIKYKELYNNVPIFLKSQSIDRFYHFTDLRNLESIVENGGLYSWSRIQKKNITSIMSSDELSRELDAKKGLQDYVRLSFAQKHPMKYKVEKEKGLNLILLEVDVSISCLENTLFSDINATDNNVTVKGNLDFLKTLDFDIFKQKYSNLDALEKKKYQAEILVKDFLPIKYIKNMDDLKEKYLDYENLPF